MPFVSTPNGKLFYAEKDEPLSPYPPLILVHGAGVDHSSWSAEIRRLPAVRVLAVDLPGHGQSQGTGYQSVIAYADSIKVVMDALKIEKAIIGGHSMGGAIAQTMAVSMPAGVAGLVLIGTGAKLGVNPSLLETIKNDYPAAVELITKWEWAKETGEELRRIGRKQLLATPSTITHGDFVACSLYDLSDTITKIQAPTLIIGGGADKMTPLALSESLAAQISNSTLVKIEGAGHKMPMECPQEVARAMTQWIEACF
ncbi:MAG: alpha/beta hydrolase [Chloroflexi bacterium]|nr:alpha/beta hydrolase [Chloroflexota bacterium]